MLIKYESLKNFLRLLPGAFSSAVNSLGANTGLNV